MLSDRRKFRRAMSGNVPTVTSLGDTKPNYREHEHWTQRITFAAETNAACSRDSADTQQ